MPTPSRTQRGGFSLCVTSAHRHTVRRRGERGQMHQSLDIFGGMGTQNIYTNTPVRLIYCANIYQRTHREA